MNKTIFQTKDSIHTITLNDEAISNSISMEMVEEIHSHLDRIKSSETKAVVFRSSGRNFSGGFDLTNFENESHGDLLFRFVRLETLLQRIRYAPFLTISLVKGASFGAGADLAISCRYRIGLPDSRFKFPGFRFGVALGTSHLACLVGPRRAADILLRNLEINSDVAYEDGLLTHLVQDASSFDELIEGLISDISNLNSSSIKRILKNTLQNTKSKDMAELVLSLSEPGLIERIRKFRLESSKSKK